MSDADVELCHWLMATLGWSYKRAMRAVESGAGARLRDTLAVKL